MRIWVASMFASLVALPAVAADWKAIEETDLVLQTAVCKASTTVTKTKLPVELSVVFPKDATLLPAVFLKISGSTQKAAWTLIRFAKKEFQPAFLIKAGASALEADIYWYAPKDLPKLLDLLTEGTTLDVVFDPKSVKPVPAQFSLNGSTAALDKAKKCAKRASLPTEFLKVMSQQAPLIAAISSSVSAQDALVAIQKAYTDYLAGLKVSESIAQLRKAMKPLTDKEAVALKELAGKQAALDKTEKDLAKVEGEITTLESQIAEANSSIPQLESAKARAETTLAQRKAPYDAGKTQLRPFESDVDNRENIYDSARDAVSSTRSRISEYQSALSDLRSQASSLRGEISRLQSDLPYAEREEASTRTALNNFNERAEVEKYLREHYRYSSIRRDLHQKNQSLRPLQNELQRERAQLQQAESALASCQASGILGARQVSYALRPAQANDGSIRGPGFGVGRPGEGSPGAGDSRPNRPGNGGGVGNPGEGCDSFQGCNPRPPEPRPTPVPTPVPTPRPRPNCSAQEAAVHAARREVNNVESRISSLEWEIQSLRREIDSIESEAQSRASNQRASLQSAYDSAASKLSEIQNSLSSKQSQLYSIESSEIPSYEDRLANAKNSLPGLLTQQADAESALSYARQALSQKRAEIGFDAIESAYIAARDTVNTLVNQISEKKNLIATGTKKLAKLRPTVAPLKQALTKQTTDRDASKAKVTAIQNQLAPQRQQESALVADLDTVKKAMAEARAQYQALVAKLSEGL